MNTKQDITNVELAETWLKEYERKSIFGGAIKWWRQVRATKMSDDLHIITDIPVDNIYLNGEKIT